MPSKGSLPKQSGSGSSSTRAAVLSPKPAAPSSHSSPADLHRRRPRGIVKKTPSHHPQAAPKRRAQVRHACLHCRTDKVKCSGTHPVCSRCNARSLVCSWDVPEEGITKTQHLQHKLAEQGARLDRLNAVVNILCHGTDKVAIEALARLRIGVSLDEILQLVGTQDPSASKPPDRTKPDQMEQVMGPWASNEPAYDPFLIQSAQYAAEQYQALS